jgi:hypothetical protein
MWFNASRLILLVTAIIAPATLSVRAGEAKGEQATDLAGSKYNVTTNSQSFKPKQNGLKQLEQDLFKPFETIAPKGSLDGAFVPPAPEPRAPTPAIQSKRVKELLERQRDWVFETPEEILATPSAKDAMTGRDKERHGNDDSKLSPMERFYERLYSKDKKETTRKGSKGNKRDEGYGYAGQRDDPEADDDADLPLGIRETQREMKRLFAPKERKGDSSADPSKSVFSDVFGLGKNTQSREEMEIQRERMDRYKELIGLPVMPKMENDPLKQFRDMIGTSPKSSALSPTMNSLGGLPQQSLFGSQSGAGVATPNGSLLPEGARIHTAPSLAPVLPKIESPKSLPPPVTFSAPRRAF